MEDVVKGLNKFGLSEKEAKAYLACLELGDSSATEISLKSDLPRTLVYDLLERLIDLGLVKYSIQDNKKYFHSADPKELVRILKEKEKAVSEVLPYLESLKKIGGKPRPKVEIYEGKEGMKTVMNEILRSGTKDFSTYGSSRSSWEIIPSYMPYWHEERAKLKIKTKIIYNNTLATRIKVDKYKSSLKYVQYRAMPISIDSPTATGIYANKVILYSWTKDPFAVVIEDEEMAKNQKRYFEELWKIAKKI